MQSIFFVNSVNFFSEFCLVFSHCFLIYMRPNTQDAFLHLKQTEGNGKKQNAKGLETCFSQLN